MAFLWALQNFFLKISALWIVLILFYRKFFKLNLNTGFKKLKNNKNSACFRNEAGTVALKCSRHEMLSITQIMEERLYD
jgi:hypothetical protein